MKTKVFENKDKAIRAAFKSVKEDLLNLQKAQIEQLEQLRKQFIDKEQFAVHNEEINSFKASLFKQISDVNEKIDALKNNFIEQSSLDEFENSLDTLSNEVDSLKTEYDEKVAEIESKQKKSLDETEKSIISQIESLQEDSVNQEELALLKSKLESLQEDSVDQKELDLIKNKVEELEKDQIAIEDLALLKSKIKELEKNHFISDSIYKKVKKIEQDFVKQDKIIEVEGLINNLSRTVEDVKKINISNIERKQKRDSKDLDKLKEIYYRIDQKIKEIKIKSTDSVLISEIKELNKKIDKIDEDNKLLLKRDAIKATIKRHRARKVEYYKSIASYVFIGLLTFSIAMYFYTQKNPFMFPGLNEKMSIVIGGLVLVLAYLYLPLGKIQFYFKKMIEKVGEKKSEAKPIEKEDSTFEKVIDYFAKDEESKEKKISKIVAKEKSVKAKKSEKKKKGPSVFEKVIDYFAGHEK